MAGMTNRLADGVIDFTVGKTALFVLPTAYLGLFTAVGTDAGTGFTEVSGGSYARVATAGTDWNAASGTGPSSNSNANALTFPTATAPWGTILAVGIFDSLSGGNLNAWDYLGFFRWMPCTVSSASPGIITCPAHGLSVGNNLVFSTELGGTGPTFSQSNFTGLLLAAHASVDTLDVTNGGIQVNTSSTGNGLIRQVTPLVVGSGATPAFSSGTFSLIAA